MFELQGKYNTAKIFTDVVDNTSISQVLNLLNQEFAKDSKIRMMPDIHAGAGCTIGTTMTIKDKVCSNLVGVDIGCGMLCVKLKEKEINLQKLDKMIYEKIPSGFSIREEKHPYYDKCRIEELCCISHIDVIRAEKSLGTLGGGNHFIEANQDEDRNLYLVIHSGSRHLGLEVANYYQEEAYRQLTSATTEEKEQLIREYKAQGRQKEIQKALKNLNGSKQTNIPKQLAYAEGQLFRDYIHDMQIVQEYADWNRQAMMSELLAALNLHESERFTTIHNYIDTDSMILRKGAVSAKKGEKLLIPINMRDGSLICIGKGNDDWNQSAPHGAGRILSRSQAKEQISMEEYQEAMKGIYTTSVSRSTLDESPMAYKKMEDITGNIGDTVQILTVIKPIYNFKAGGEG